jgi:hypothetical protein
MRDVLVVLVATLIFGCGDNSSQSVLPDWGYLPSMSVGKGDCRDRTIANIPYGVEDNQKPLYTDGKRSSGKSRLMYIGETCLIASISTVAYEADEDQVRNHYSISVLVPQVDTRCTGKDRPEFCERGLPSYRIIYNRYLPQGEVGQYFKGRRMEDIVEVNKESKTVSFKVREKTYAYRLPDL